MFIQTSPPVITRLSILALLGSLILVSCNMPRKGTSTPSEANLIYTAAAETVAAQLTQVGQAGSPAPQTPATTSAPTLTLTNTSLPPTTTPVPPTQTPIPCDRAEFVKDVSYPDNTEVAPGLVFVKTWRLRNGGSCTWTAGYAVVLTSGDSIGVPASVPLTGNVAPGQTMDVSVSLTAPSVGGTYRGDFKLRNASNIVFGLGENNKPFFVQIKVGAASGLLLDFISKASAAQWESGASGSLDTTLAFGGADEDANGVVKIKEGVTLENGSASSKILLTFPKHQNDGLISGTYPSYLVQAGDYFKARIGFIVPGGSCGAGQVKFQLMYKEGGTIKPLAEWPKACNGSLLPVDIDLSSLKGKTIQFVLVVKSQGAFDEDWAIWNSPRIEHP